MAIESDIFNEVETLLDGMTTANGYNFTWNVETRDENLDPAAMDLATNSPLVLVRYGRAGQMVRSVQHTTLAGRILEMLPIDIRVYLHDSRSGDTISVKTAKAHEDIKKAIGQNLRDNISAVYDAFVGAPIRPFDTFQTDYEVIEFPVEVWHDYAQHEVVAPTPSGLRIPTNIVFTVAKGELKITFDAPASYGATGVNLYKNETTAASAYTGTEWFDSAWVSTDVWRLGATDGSSEVLTERIAFPYYPVYTPEIEYYKETWLLGTKLSGRMIPGATSPEALIENEIRKTLEVERLDTGVLGDVNYTVAGPLVYAHLVNSRFPLINIQHTVTNQSFLDTSEQRRLAEFMIDIYEVADPSVRTITESRSLVNKIVHQVQEIVLDNESWNNAGNAVKSEIVRLQAPVIEPLGRMPAVIRGQLLIRVDYQWIWRE